MESKPEVTSLVNEYTRSYKNEDLTPLHLFLEQNDNLYSRNNFNGHITASAFIVIPQSREILFLKHKLYDRYLQPGGHIEAGDLSIAAASLREVVEETGISKSELTLMDEDRHPCPVFDIDSHDIPANDKRKELAHIHHDFRYLFFYSGNRQLSIPSSESKDGKWFSLEEARRISIFTRVVDKIANAIF